MNNKIKVAYHPWTYLRDELYTRGRTQTKFAELLWISKSELNDLIHWRRNITPKTAMIIALALDEDADVRMRLQNRRDKYQIEKNRENITLFQEILARKKELALA